MYQLVQLSTIISTQTKINSMLRFIKHHLTGIDGVSFYPIFSLLIFFIFFTVMITYVIRMKRKEVDELSNIPFESNEEKSEKSIVISKK